VKGGLNKVKTKVKDVMNRPIMAPTMTKDQHMKKIKKGGGDPSHWESFNTEANSDQMKAMKDAKMKKMEDDKVSEKKNKKNVKEDAKMGRMSDGDLEKGHKKFSSMDQTSPSNKFMVKRFSNEIKRRKKKKLM
jgi:hypothetical protein